MNPKLKEKTLGSLAAVLPITGIVFLISLLIVPLPLSFISLFLAGALMLILGMGFFELGAEMSMTPIGEGIGAQVSKIRKLPIIMLIGFLMGVIITVSEPDLQVLAEQVPSVDNMALILTVAVGVGIFLSIAVMRIILQIDLSVILIVFYALLLILSFFVPRNFISVAFDSGGVTTGPMTVPFIMALGVGIAGVRGDKNATSDSFGLVSLSSIGPILAVMLLGIFSNSPAVADTSLSVLDVNTTTELAVAFLDQLPRYIKEVCVSVLPIVAVFFLFQLLTHRYRKSQIKRVIIGFLYTCIGLILFLCGVNVGFAPVGTYLGHAIAALKFKWIIVPIGALIGYYIVKAEPAIQVLNHQVDSVTNGAISVKAMNTAMSIGVSVSVGLSMLRVLLGIPLLYIVVTGYIIALILSLLVPKIFVGIAFDSGGVASGPLTTTFLLPLSIGVCTAVGGNLLEDAFGVVALVALTPLITVQIMGIIYKLKTAKVTAVKKPEFNEFDEIIEFEEA